MAICEILDFMSNIWQQTPEITAFAKSWNGLSMLVPLTVIQAEKAPYDLDDNRFCRENRPAPPISLSSGDDQGQSTPLPKHAEAWDGYIPPDPKNLVRLNGTTYNFSPNSGMGGHGPNRPSMQQPNDYNHAYFLWVRREQHDGDSLEALQSFQSGKHGANAFNALLYSLPLDMIIEIGPDIIAEMIDEDIHPNGQEKLDLTLPSRIVAAASGLSHENADDVRRWGKAIDDVRVSALAKLKDNCSAFENLGQDQPKSTYTRDLHNLLTAKSPTGLARVFLPITRPLYRHHIIGKPTTEYAVNSSYRIQLKGPHEQVIAKDYRLMSPAEKSTRAIDIIDGLDAQTRAEIETLEKDEPRLERNLEIATLYHNITGAYMNALQRNRERLIEDERTALDARVDDADSDAALLRTGFSKSAGIESDVDARINALKLSVAACAREALYHQSVLEMAQEFYKQKQFLVNERLPAVRAQYDQAHLKAMGNALEHDAQSAAILSALKPAQREQKKWDLAMTDIIAELNTMITEQEGQENTQRLLTSGSDPVALIEQQKLIAIPDMRSPAEIEKAGLEA